jgi:hypothetical protein
MFTVGILCYCGSGSNIAIQQETYTMAKQKNLPLVTEREGAGSKTLANSEDPPRAWDPAALFAGRATMAFEKEAARIMSDDATRRANGGTSLHLVGTNGVLSGFIRDEHATIRFSGGAFSVTAHD